MIIAFFITSFLITLSVLGYGLLSAKILNFKYNDYNFGLLGILGLFFLSIVSSYTHIFFSHNFFHNLIIIMIGLFLLFSFRKKNQKIFKKNLTHILIIFSLLFIALILAKTNEDYSYYHLPNSLQFAQQKLQFGIGNLNHGFKHISSLFMLQSLNYVPLFNHYLFNLTNFIFLVLFVQFILIEIYHRSKINNNLSQIFLTFFLILFLVKFSRIAEYGSDLAGQIIISIYIFFIIEIVFNNELNRQKITDYIKLTLILLVFAITTKFILSIYFLFFILAFFILKNKIEIFKKILEKKFLIILALPTIFFLFFNFTSTGCILYPVEFTCFSEKFSWALSSNTVNNLNFHYEIWSKGGRGPNFEIENQEAYINSFNWVSHWFFNYFFTKISDYLLVSILIIFIFGLFFLKEIFFIKSFVKKKNINSLLFYVISVSVFLLWFLNFPSLRYSGYIIVFLLIIFPVIYFLNHKIDFKREKILKKISIIFLISYTIFLVKNLDRINDELSVKIHNHHNFNNFPFYWVEDTNYEKIFINGHELYKTKGKCWDIPSTCVRTTENLRITKFKSYIFYSFR